MRTLIVVIALALVACHPPVPVARPLDEFAVSVAQPSSRTTYILYKFLQRIGIESDTATPIADGGVEAKASFIFNDRGTHVPLAASFRLAKDGSTRRFDAWGFVARQAPADDHVLALGDGRFAVRSLDVPTRVVTPSGPFAVAAAYAPLLGQELLAQRWIALGRPPRLALLPAGEVAVESRGHESYPLDGRQVSFEHIVITGLVWGRQDLWLDDKSKLAAVVTRDAEFDHFEGVRDDYMPLVEAFVARAGADAVAWLADAAHRRDEVGPVALVGGRLVDGSGAPPVEDAVVVYEGDRILAAGPRATTAVPANARRIDVHGETILPGLWDMHAHVEQVEQAAVYLAAGVTTVRDEGNILEFITALRDTIDDGHGVGPRIIADGIVDSDSPYAIGTLRVSSPADIAPIIDRLVKAHCAELKIYSSLKPELVPALVAEAHRRGLRVTGHVPAGMTIEEAVDDGFDGINHVSMMMSMVFPRDLGELRKLSPAQRQRLMVGLDVKSPAIQRVLGKMAERKIAFDPTIALYEETSFPAAELDRREAGRAKLPRELRNMFPGVDPAKAADGEARFKKYLEIIAEAHRRGVPIVAGTDQAILGHSLHRELELYVAAGLTPMEALQSATSVPAKLLGRDKELGTVSAGKRADIIVVAGNPLADIRDTRKVTLVIARGHAYEPAPLWKLAGFQP